MPICPNCGGWVSEGSPVCSCGTPMGGSVHIPDEVDKEELTREVRDEIIRNMVKRRTDEAKWLAENGKCAEAIKKYEDALDIKYSRDIVRKIADLYYNMGEYEKALEYIDPIKENSIDDKMKFALYLIELGRYDEATDELNEAIEDVERKFQIEPFDEDRAGDKEYVEIYKSRYNDNEKEKFEYFSRIYNDLGWIHYKRGQLDEAIKLYEKGIGYDQNFAGNWNCKAIVLHDRMKYDEALKFYDIALEIDAGDKAISNNRESCLKEYGKAYLSGKYPVKSKYLERALELAGEDSDDDFETETIEKPVVKKDWGFGKQAKLLNEIGKENLITIAVTSDIDAPEFRKGMMLQLVTEEDNTDDGDAIAVYLDNDKVGYVANSDGTCCGMTSRASDIRIDEIAFAEYLFYYIERYHVAKMIW